MQISLSGKNFLLLPQKALYKPDEELLVVADVHLGKAKHFTKSGINLPPLSQRKDYQNLSQLLITLQPKKVYFLGDLFHSAINSEWMHFENFINAFSGTEFTLVKGNHDTIDSSFFARIGVVLVDEYLEDEHFIYSHTSIEDNKEKIVFAGHVHPNVILLGKARQRVKLPCFYFSNNCFLLPSFGSLTGSYTIKPNKNDRVFVVYGNVVEEINL